MDMLDGLVTHNLVERLLAPERLEALLAAVAARRAERTAAVDERIAGLQARADEADERQRRLFKMVEDRSCGDGRSPEGPRRSPEGRP